MLAFTADDRWVPGIGDPTIMGWVTVAAYFVAAILCWRLVFLTVAGVMPQQRQLAWFWAAFAILMTFLGINKQLDLQTWLTLFGKHLAQNEGWYEQRRPVQAVFVLLVAGAGAVTLLFLARLTQPIWRQTWVALTGGVFLGCFIIVRAASFHHVDQLLRTHFGGVKVNWMLELGGIFWVALGAALNLHWLKDRGHS